MGLATKALDDFSSTSASLFGADAEGTEMRTKSNEEIASLKKQVEAAKKMEKKARKTVSKLERIKMRAEAASLREAAVKAEAAAFKLKKNLIDAIEAIERMDADVS